MIRPLSPAAPAGIGAVLLAVLLAFISPSFAFAPPAVFILLCLIAPFFPRLGFYLPVITRGTKGTDAAALTFDDGPSPETTPLLLGLLKKYGVPAAHFVIGAKAAAHPGLIKEILAQGHDLGNHTMTHDTLMMLKSSAVLSKEIENCQDGFSSFGVRPLTFRPPAGIVNPRLGPQLLRLGMYCVLFSRRGRDWGNRRVEGMARRVLGRIRAGDIVMLHDRPPKGGATVEKWLGQVEEVITGIRARGLRIVPLAELIGRPVMTAVKNKFGGIK